MTTPVEGKRFLTKEGEVNGKEYEVADRWLEACVYASYYVAYLVFGAWQPDFLLARSAL